MKRELNYNTRTSKTTFIGKFGVIAILFPKGECQFHVAYKCLTCVSLNRLKSVIYLRHVVNCNFLMNKQIETTARVADVEWKSMYVLARSLKAV